MQIKRRLIVLLLAGIMILSANSVGFAEEVTIRIAHWLGDPAHDASAQILMDEVAEYLAPYGIKLESVITAGGSTYKDNVVVQMAGGVGPDIIFALPYSHYNIQDMLIDLAPYLESDKELNFGSFIPVAWDLFTYNGETKLLPIAVSPYLMFYNRQHMQEAGMADPDKSWTWSEDIAGATTKLLRADSDGKVERYGLLLENRLFTPFFSEGGEILSEDGSQSVFNRPENAAAGKLLSDIYRWLQDGVIPKLTNHRPTFSRGEGTLHAVMGTFAFPYYVDNATNIDWSFTYPPQGKAGLQIDENANGWGISALSKHPEEAWLVLKAMAAVSGRTTLQVYGGFSPVKGKNDSATVEYMSTQLGLSQAQIDIAFDSMNYVRPRFRHPLADDITLYINRAFAAIARNGAAPGTQMQSTAELIDGVIKGQ